MKTGRKVLLVLGAVILVAALVAVYMTYSRQAAERSDLETRLNLANDRLPVLAASKNDLEGELAAAQSSLNTTALKFLPFIESIEYGEYLWDVVRKCNVDLASLSFPRPSARTVGPVTYSVVSLSLPISGTLDNVFKFIDVMRTDPRFASTEIKTISMSLEGGTVSATIVIDVYAYKG